MIAQRLTVKECQRYREFRRKQVNRDGDNIRDTTINRDLSKISKAFKHGIKMGKVLSMPPGGTDFRKEREKTNVRQVRFPDRYVAFFRDALHPALRCLFTCGFYVGVRRDVLLNLTWADIDFARHRLHVRYQKGSPAREVPMWA